MNELSALALSRIYARFASPASPPLHPVLHGQRAGAAAPCHDPRDAA